MQHSFIMLLAPAVAPQCSHPWHAGMPDAGAMGAGLLEYQQGHAIVHLIREGLDFHMRVV
jgi:hypothetical protein